ncbi:hypothetical protein P692DRAFT_20840692, partial [Suillus brevipes Sb2]
MNNAKLRDVATTCLSADRRTVAKRSPRPRKIREYCQVAELAVGRTRCFDTARSVI